MNINTIISELNYEIASKSLGFTKKQFLALPPVYQEALIQSFLENVDKQILEKKSYDDIKNKVLVLLKKK